MLYYLSFIVKSSTLLLYYLTLLVNSSSLVQELSMIDFLLRIGTVNTRNSGLVHKNII